MRLPPTLLLAAALAAQGVTAASKAAPSPAITTPLICIPTGGHNLCTASGVVVVNEKRQFTVDVPDGTGSLSVRLTPSGGKGDADLEVVPPPESSAVRKTSRESTGPDTVTYASPPPGTYTIAVAGFGDETAFLAEVEFGAAAAPAAPSSKLAPLHGDTLKKHADEPGADDAAEVDKVEDADAADVDRPHTFPSATRNRASGGKLIRPQADDDGEGERGDGSDVDRAGGAKAARDVDGGGDRAGGKEGAADSGSEKPEGTEKEGDDDKKKKDAGRAHEDDDDDDDDDDKKQATHKALPVPAAGAGPGDPHLVRPGGGGGEDEGGSGGGGGHAPKAGARHDHHDGDDDDGDDDGGDDDHHHHHAGSPLLTKALSILTALAAAVATLWAARTWVPALVAAGASRRWAPASRPLAGLGAFDDGFADAEPLDASGMEMGGWGGGRPKPPPGGGGGSGGGGGGSDPNPAARAHPVLELKARAGGVPVGPVINASGGIGAYRPPQAPPVAEAEVGEVEEGRAPPPPPPPPPPAQPEDPFL